MTRYMVWQTLNKCLVTIAEKPMWWTDRAVSGGLVYVTYIEMTRLANLGFSFDINWIEYRMQERKPPLNLHSIMADDSALLIVQLLALLMPVN